MTGFYTNKYTASKLCYNALCLALYTSGIKFLICHSVINEPTLPASHFTHPNIRKP